MVKPNSSSPKAKRLQFGLGLRSGQIRIALKTEPLIAQPLRGHALMVQGVLLNCKTRKRLSDTYRY